MIAFDQLKQDKFGLNPQKWIDNFLSFYKGRPYGEPNAPGQGERVSQMDTPCSQPSYSSTYHPSESLIQLRTG